MPKKKVSPKKKSSKSISLDHLNLVDPSKKFTEHEKELYIKHFRIAIFGSARISKSDKVYKEVYALAKDIGTHGFDIVTGGGPGLMEAANAGHEAGDKYKIADSIGLTIRLPWEAKENRHLDIKSHFDKFTSRLDKFMVLSNVFIVVPGGIGTCLELFYTWQLIQVKHIYSIPIILFGPMWEKLIDWVKLYPLKQNLLNKEDFDCIHIAKNKEEAIEIIMELYKVYKMEGTDYKFNFDKYKVKL